MFKVVWVSILCMSSLFAYDEAELMRRFAEDEKILSNPTIEEEEKAKVFADRAEMNLGEDPPDVYEAIDNAKAAIELDPQNTVAQKIIAKYFKLAYPDPTLRERMQNAKINAYVATEVIYDENVSRLPDNTVSATDKSDTAAIITALLSKKFGSSEQFKVEAMMYNKNYATVNTSDVAVYGLKLYRTGYKGKSDDAVTVVASLGYQHIVSDSHSLINQFAGDYKLSKNFDDKSASLTLGYAHKFFTREALQIADADAYSLVFDLSTNKWKEKGIHPSIKLGYLKEEADSAASSFDDFYGQVACSLSPKDWSGKSIATSIKYLLKSPDILDSSRRLTAKASYSHPVAKGQAIKASLSFESSESDTNSFDYDKTVFGLAWSISI